MNNKGINNKGFTLIELLAVMTILLSISIIAITSVSSSLNRNDKAKEESEIEVAKNAAKIYFANKNMMTKDSYVKIADLASSGYLDLKKYDSLRSDYHIVICDSYSYQASSKCY